MSRTAGVSGHQRFNDTHFSDIVSPVKAILAILEKFVRKD